MASVYRVAIIGLGVIGRRMLTNMPEHERLEVVGGWDLNPEVRAAASVDHPWLTVPKSAEALIALPETDIVYIGVPPQAHGRYTRAAVAAGKAVFCEKPLGVDLTESRKLMALVEQSGLPQAINLSLAGARGVAAMRAALTDGSLGEIAGADIRLHFSRWPRGWQESATWLAGRTEGGFTREVVTHFIYLAGALFGPGRLIAASAGFPEDREAAERTVLARLAFGDVPVTLAGTAGGAGPDLVEFTLWGSRRSFRLTDFYRLWSSDGSDWKEEFPEIKNPALDAYMRQLNELVKLMDGTPHVLPDFRTALGVQELIEAILAYR